jgi:CIC family chloride channel protein
MLGGIFGYLDKSILHHSSNQIGAFALVGMGAVFAGIIRAPITSVLIIFEMTGSYELILPLMISNMTAYALARHLRPTPIYEALLHQDGIYLPHRGGRVSHALERLTVGSAMTTNPIAISATSSIAEALRRIEQYHFSTYPVVNDQGGFVGIVTEARLRRTVAEGGLEKQVKDIAQQAARVEPQHSLTRAVVRMEKSAVRQLAVVDSKDNYRLIGLLTMSDIVGAHARAAVEAGDPDRSTPPEPLPQLPEHIQQQ